MKRVGGDEPAEVGGAGVVGRAWTRVRWMRLYKCGVRFNLYLNLKK